MIENQLDIIHTTLINLREVKRKEKGFIIMTYEQHNDNFTCSSPNGIILQTHRALSFFLSPGHLFMPIQQHSLKLLERPSMAQIKQCFHVLKWSIIIINN